MDVFEEDFIVAPSVRQDGVRRLFSPNEELEQMCLGIEQTHVSTMCRLRIDGSTESARFDRPLDGFIAERVALLWMDQPGRGEGL